MTQSEAPRRSIGYRPVLVTAVLLFLVLLGLASLKSWRDLEAARGREHRLETEIRETGARIEQLQGRIERLRSNPGSLERLAREDLGMVRPGDVVIVLPDNPDGRPLALPPRAVPLAVPMAEVPAAVAAVEPSVSTDVTPAAATAGSLPPPPTPPAR